MEKKNILTFLAGVLIIIVLASMVGLATYRWQKFLYQKEQKELQERFDDLGFQLYEIRRFQAR